VKKLQQVANEPLAHVVVGAAKTPKTLETSTKFDFFSPPVASETSEKKKSTPSSVMIPSGERNHNQNVNLLFLPNLANNCCLDYFSLLRLRRLQ
jgi:hypothetical protein